MLFRRVSALGLLLVLGLGTAACTEDGYGYSGISLGYGSPGYYDYGYAPAHYGWYGDYYYPGSGYYVYDRGRRPHRWNEGQRRYWEARRSAWRNREVRENWADFRRERRGDWRDFRRERRGDRAAYRRGDVSRPAFRSDRQQDRREYRRDYRQDRRELRRENRRDRRN